MTMRTDEQLEQLKCLFTDRPVAELQTILSRHNDNLEAAVEAICSGETAAVATRAVGNDNRPASSSSEVDLFMFDVSTPDAPPRSSYKDGPTTAAATSAFSMTPTVAVIPPLKEVPAFSIINNNNNNNSSSQSTVIATGVPSSFYTSTVATIPPLASKLAAINSEQQQQHQLREQEELQQALENSKAPWDRGRFLSDKALSELVRDPAFLASLDDDEDLKAAVELQQMLDTEEQAWAMMSSSSSTNNSHNPVGAVGVTPGSLASPPDSLHFSNEASREVAAMNSGVSNTALSTQNQISSMLSIRPALRDKLQTLGGSFLRACGNTLSGTTTGSRDDNSPTEHHHQQREIVDAIRKREQDHEEEERQHQELIKEAEAACFKAIQDHLNEYLSQHPGDTGTYEGWIEEVHPENAHDGLLLPNMSKTIDHRFYLHDSDHRRLWNDSIGNSGRRFVPPRTNKVTHTNGDGMPLDLLDVSAATPVTSGGDNGDPFALGASAVAPASTSYSNTTANTTFDLLGGSTATSYSSIDNNTSSVFDLLDSTSGGDGPKTATAATTTTATKTASSQQYNTATMNFPQNGTSSQSHAGGGATMSNAAVLFDPFAATSS